MGVKSLSKHLLDIFPLYFLCSNIWEPSCRIGEWVAAIPEVRWPLVTTHNSLGPFGSLEDLDLTAFQPFFLFLPFSGSRRFFPLFVFTVYQQLSEEAGRCNRPRRWKKVGRKFDSSLTLHNFRNGLFIYFNQNLDMNWHLGQCFLPILKEILVFENDIWPYVRLSHTLWTRAV